MSDQLDLSGTNPWRTTRTSVVYDNGRLRLREDAVVAPDGEPTTYTYLDLKYPIVGIVPLDEEKHVYLVRQWRYAWQCNSWEIPAGQCEADEDLVAGARRELAEEVGLAASHWEPLASGFTSASIGARYHLFLARGLQPARPATRDGSEGDLIARRVPFERAVQAVLDGTIVHSLSAVAILRAARLLGL